jgi:hypothetical protein
MPRPGEPRAAALIAGEIDSSTRNGACTIVRGKGSTYYGIGAGIARIVAAIRQDEQAVLWFSTAKAEVEGVRDVALSMPRLVGREGGSWRALPRPRHRRTRCPSSKRGDAARALRLRRALKRPSGRTDRSSMSSSNGDAVVEFELLKDKGVLVLRPMGPLTAVDFGRIAQAVDPYIVDKGRLTGVLIDAPAFPGWESFGALIEHMKFVRSHHQKIERIAVVTDSEILKLAPRIAEHFARPAFKVFGSGERDGALAWLETGA